MDAVAIIGAVAGLLGAVVGVGSLFLSASKAQLDALAATVDTVQKENGRLSERLEDAERDVRRLERREARLRKGINALIAQLRDLGVDPAWTPECDEELALEAT